MSIHTVKSKTYRGKTLYAVFIGGKAVSESMQTEEEANSWAKTLDDRYYARKAEQEKKPPTEEDDSPSP